MTSEVRSIRKVSRIVAVFLVLVSILFMMSFNHNIVLGIVFMLVTGVAAYYALVRILRILVQNKFRSVYEIMKSREVATKAVHDSVNISEDLRQLAERNVDEISRLKADEQYRKEFLGDVSHEIKTPLFALQGYVLTILDGAIDDAALTRKYLERSELSIDRLISIVTDLEAITKLESGQLRLQYDGFDVVDLCQEITEAFYIEAKKKDISISYIERSGHPDVVAYGDRRRIGQVLSNLIMNAIRYGRDGGFIKVSIDDLEDKILVEVSDNGVGIKPEDQARIFDRFYRVDRSRSRASGGTGLGLSIVKHILEAHGESISVRSRLGEGTVFSFTLGK